MLETSIPAGLERRREDYRLITGAGRYVDDLRPPEGRPPALYMAVVRSPYAHAQIKGMRMGTARTLPGVVVALEGAELVSNLPPVEPLPIPLPGLKKPTRKALAVDRARYAGDPVAVVLADEPSRRKRSW